MNKPGNIAAGYRPCGEGSGIYESRSEKQPLLEKMSDFFPPALTAMMNTCLMKLRAAERDISRWPN